MFTTFRVPGGGRREGRWVKTQMESKLPTSLTLVSASVSTILNIEGAAAVPSTRARKTMGRLMMVVRRMVLVLVLVLVVVVGTVIHECVGERVCGRE